MKYKSCCSKSLCQLLWKHKVGGDYFWVEGLVELEVIQEMLQQYKSTGNSTQYSVEFTLVWINNLKKNEYMYMYN